MPKLVTIDVGPRTVPQEVRDLRKSSLEFHHTLGQPVIHKHKWNEDDLREGRAQRCPFHDPLYDRESDWCEYCFGTGYLGGWANGEIVYVSLADVQQDVFAQTPQGILVRQESPGMTAPWYPTMGDGDLIIEAEFHPHTWEVLDVYDRFMIQEVRPTTMRGPGFDNEIRGKRWLVGQEAIIDKIPRNSPEYVVPIDFDYNDVPLPPVDPNIDPDDYPPNTKFSAYEVGIRVVGFEPAAKSSRSQDIRVATAGTETAHTASIKLNADAGGSVVILD